MAFGGLQGDGLEREKQQATQRLYLLFLLDFYPSTFRICNFLFSSDWAIVVEWPSSSRGSSLPFRPVPIIDTVPSIFNPYSAPLYPVITSLEQVIVTATYIFLTAFPSGCRVFPSVEN